MLKQSLRMRLKYGVGRHLVTYIGTKGKFWQGYEESKPVKITTSMFLQQLEESFQQHYNDILKLEEGNLDLESCV